jgi:hypothetical protein
LGEKPTEIERFVQTLVDLIVGGNGLNANRPMKLFRTETELRRRKDAKDERLGGGSADVSPAGATPSPDYIVLMPRNAPMPSKLLVRHVALGKFLGPAGRWVKRAESAFNFPNLLNAINTCLGRRLKDVELILRYDDGMPDRCIPLDAIQ